MTYTTAEGRGQVLDELASGIEQIGDSLALLTEAYERLDERAADRLEDELFRPVQTAYARGKRTHAEFAARYGLRGRAIASLDPAGRVEDVRDALARAADALQGADDTLAELQDSMLPVEVGDPELRGGISSVRTAIAPLPERARQLLRLFGR